WADEMSVSFLHSLTSAFLDAHPILVLGIYRTEDAPEALRELVTGTNARAFTLDGLPGDAIGAMVGEMLALPEPPPELVRLVTEQSEGNPFFATEYLHAAVGEGLLVRDPSGRWMRPNADLPLDELPLPPTLRDLVERRLAHLPPGAVDLAQAAACLGRDFDGEMLVAVVDAVAESAPFVQQLLQRCVLEESGNGRLRFAHDKLRETIHRGIQLERRSELHHRAAVALERVADDSRRPYAVLAHHWLEAKLPDKALECLGAAGERALQAAAYRDAADFFARALDVDAR